MCLSNVRMTRSAFRVLSLAARERSYYHPVLQYRLEGGLSGSYSCNMQFRVVSTYMDMVQAAVSNTRYMNRIPRSVATGTKSRGRVERIDPCSKMLKGAQRCILLGSFCCRLKCSSSLNGARNATVYFFIELLFNASNSSGLCAKVCAAWA
jgi:hypothetical protein